VSDDSPDLKAVWARTLEGLADTSIAPAHRAFVGLTRPLGLLDDTALLAAPNDFTKNRLETDLRAVVTQRLSLELGREVRIAVTVDPSLNGTADGGHPTHASDGSDGAAGAVAVKTTAPTTRDASAGYDGRPDLLGGSAGPTDRTNGMTHLESASQYDGTVHDATYDGAYDAAAVAAEAYAPVRRPEIQRHEPTPPPARPGTGRDPSRREAEPTRLNTRYIFETFVIG
jgi:chromosomal replication initiator protein